ncbi:DUF4082 domain-containing protein [Actinokineospora sp. NPDC004072]
MRRIFTAAAAVLVAAAGTVLLHGTASAAPVPSVAYPTPGAPVQVGVPLRIAGAAINGEAGDVTRVEISFDAGVTWQPTDYRAETWSLLHTPTAPGPVSFHLRAFTPTQGGAVHGPFTFTAGGAAAPPPTYGHTLTLDLLDLPGTQRVDDPDSQAVELGLRFQVDRPGAIPSGYLWRGAYTGPITVHLWSADGALLAETTATAGTGRYQPFTFATPVQLTPNTDYTLSYYTPAGGYAVSEDYFSGAIFRAPFHTPVGAGVYRYGGGYPTDTWNSSNYWIIPRFTPAP